MRQRELEIRLERVRTLAAPNPNLEQYRTPPKIAADILYRALARGDVADRRIVDAGCGSGIFLVGAALLGARSVTGIDVDPASVALAQQTLREFQLEGTVLKGSVENLSGDFDTAIMNPPFGAQLAARHLDSVFLSHALRVAPVAYSLHLEETHAFIERFTRTLDVRLERLRRYDFPLPHQFAFHSKEKVLVPVALYRFQRMGRTE